jgi:polyhydroxyalkanoate synthesis regulator phasin
LERALNRIKVSTRLLSGVLCAGLLLLSAGLLTQIAGCNASAAKPAAKTGTGAAQGTGGREQNITQAMATLVKDKTITQAQADKISAYLQTQAQNRRERMEQSKNNNTAPPQGSSTEKPDGQERRSPLSELVKDGTITQEQADAVAKVLFTRGPGPQATGK